MKVKFLPTNVELEIKPGQTVMNLAHEHQIPIKTVCNGIASCAECRVRVVDGDWNLVPPSPKELAQIGTGYFVDQRRLSCQLTCFGDITVDITEQLEKANQSTVNKKFLARTDKASADQLHAKGGILVEDEQAVFQQLGNSAVSANDSMASASNESEDAEPQNSTDADLDRPAQQTQSQRPGQNQSRSGGNNGPAPHRPGGGGGHGGGRRRRRRGGGGGGGQRRDQSPGRR